MQTIAFCEQDPFCQKVLAKHWPETPLYSDIKTLSKERLDNDGLSAIDLICGGFPCQPFSCAGKQKGAKDDRHLWPEVRRLIAQLRPTWGLFENVTGLIPLGLDAVLSDLENEGYTCRAFIIPACAVGALHRRDRVWIIAHHRGHGTQGSVPQSIQGEPLFSRLQDVRGLTYLPDGSLIPEPLMGRDHDGFSRRVDRLRALGNAVVPSVVEAIGRVIAQSNAHTLPENHSSHLCPE